MSIPDTPVTFAQLSADQLAEHALNIFITQGRHIEGSRVIYHALQLDPQHPLAMRCLSDFLAYEGTETFAAAVLEYALSPACSLSDEARKTLDDLLFLSIWSWGLSSHKSGEPNLSGDAFDKREDFTLDQEAYDKFIGSLISRTGSLEQAYQSAITLCGSIAGFLQHNSKPVPDLADCFDRANFTITPVYEQWLAESPGLVEELKASVERMKQADDPSSPPPVEEKPAPAPAPKKPWWKIW